MRYIENLELREWVKENLRKAIFQKAHALAVQTGCEILVKLKDDIAEQAQGYYYATNHLGKTYDIAGVHKQPGDLPISGETGLPIVPMVDQAIQSHDTQTGANDSLELKAQEVYAVQRTSDDHNTAEPVQLSLGVESESQTENAQSPSSISDTTVCRIKQEIDDLDEAIAVKLEVIEEDLDTSTEQVDLDMQVENAEPTQDYHSYAPPPMVPMSPKPYQCGMCRKAFRSIQVLQKHTQTFHMRPQHVMARKRGAYGGGAGMTKHKQQFHAPFATPEQQRFQCVVCNRSFRHLGLLEDHMNRSHMVHPSPLSASQQTGFSSASSDAAAIATQSSNSLHLAQEAQDTNNQATSTDPSLPKIASVASLHHLVPTTSGVPSSSNAPFSQASPMGPIYRHPSLSGSGNSLQAAGSSSSSSRVPMKQKHRKTRIQFRYEGPAAKVPTKERIMSAILLTPGPVCSYRSITQSGPPSLRAIGHQEYNSAASTLEVNNLGTQVDVAAGHMTKLMFVKQAPSLAEPILQGLPEVCRLNDYKRRFQCKISVKINKSIRKQLTGKGYVTEEQMRY